MSRVYARGSRAVKWAAIGGCLLGSSLLAVGAGAGRPDTEQARRDEARLGRWSRLLQQGEAAAVLDSLRTLHTLLAADARWQNLRGSALAAAGRDREAVTAFEAGLRLDPLRPELHRNLAAALVRLGWTGRALSEFEEAVRLSPEDAVARLGWARELVRLRRYGAAMEALAPARARAGEDPRVATLWAEVLEGEGRTEAAVQAWKAVLALAPGADPHRHLGRLLRRTAPALARDHFDSCAVLDSTALDCREAVAALALEQDDPQAAIGALAGAIDRISEEGYQNLILALQRTGRVDALEAALGRRVPTRAEAWALVALARREAERSDAALEALARARELGPVSAEIWNLEGVLRAERGEMEAARRAWMAALELDPAYAPARRNLESSGH